jgi:hypothetical protein
MIAISAVCLLLYFFKKSYAMIILKELCDEKVTRLHMAGSFRLLQEDWMNPGKDHSGSGKQNKDR